MESANAANDFGSATVAMHVNFQHHGGGCYLLLLLLLSLIVVVVVFAIVVVVLVFVLLFRHDLEELVLAMKNAMQC